MKRLNLLVVLLAVLGIAGIVFAQQQSSSATPQPHQNAATGYAAGPWLCPMWGPGWTNPTNHSGTRGPGWMMGNGYPAPRGAYGPMGPGMMYTPDTNTMAGRSRPQSGKAAPAENQQQPQPER